MSGMNQHENVQRQYSDDKNLSARINLHAKHSRNKQDFVLWLFEHYRFSDNDAILEMGCGNGRQWEGRLLHLPPGCSLTLSDFSEGMVNATREKFSAGHSNIDFRQIDIQDIPYNDATFNVIIANHMLYHVPDLDKALSETYRVLKPGGCFYSATNGNGGMSLYLHNVMKQFDPKTTAFAQTFSFNLQNGSELLGRYFSAVQRFDYENSLAVTDTQDLMNWLESTMTMSGLREEYLDGLHNYFETIRVRDGAINIPIECGLFICEK